jgi:hypothetical protein
MPGFAEIVHIHGKRKSGEQITLDQTPTPWRRMFASADGSKKMDSLRLAKV